MTALDDDDLDYLERPDTIPLSRNLVNRHHSAESTERPISLEGNFRARANQFLALASAPCLAELPELGDRAAAKAPDLSVTLHRSLKRSVVLARRTLDEYGSAQHDRRTLNNACEIGHSSLQNRGAATCAPWPEPGYVKADFTSTFRIYRQCVEHFASTRSPRREGRQYD